MNDDRGVSPVIGVILLVAITVILAAVIGTFVFSLGEGITNETPQSSLELETDASTNNLTISHKGGDALHADRTRLEIQTPNGDVTVEPAGSDDTPLSVGQSAEFSLNSSTGPNTGAWSEFSSFTGSSTISSGDSITVTVIDTQSQRIVFETQTTV